MEPITLCGLVIVAFGLWIELESKAKTLARAVCNSNVLQRMTAIVTVEQKPASAVIFNRR